MKKVRIKDIAEKASVSVTTVSLVLNDAPSRISEEKKKEIKAIAKELNYRPSHLARSLSMQKTFSLGLIIPDIQNPYFSSLAKKIDDLCRQKGYLVYTLNSDDKTANDVTMVQNLVDREVDGIFLCVATESYAQYDTISKLLDSVNTPLVLLDRILPDKAYNQVGFDNELGGFKATSYLIKSGSKKIAIFNGLMETHNAKQRYLGYQRALNHAGIALDNSLVFEGDYRFDTGYKLGLKVLKDPSIDGVFATNDLMAYGFQKAQREVNIKRKINVVGYDNLEYSKMFDIPLISVEQDVDALAEKAVEILFKVINKKAEAKIHILNPVLDID